jgi:hypothetical protein
MTRSRAKASTYIPRLVSALWSKTSAAVSMLRSLQGSSVYPLTHISGPDKYTIVPAPLKILKVLVVELQSASGATVDASAAADLADDGSDDGEWEDEPNPFVDLGSGFSREQLMAFAAEEPGGSRQRDDETQGFLVEFFKRAATTHGFAEEFSQLTEEEQQRLRDSAA